MQPAGSVFCYEEAEAVTHLMFCFEVVSHVKSADKLQGRVVWR